MAKPELQAAMDRVVEGGTAPAVVAVVVKSGSVLFEASAGLADPETGQAMNGRTPLRQASVAKPYVASTLIQIAHQQRVALDTPIDEFLTQEMRDSLLAGGYQPSLITLDHLLTHTAGLRDHSGSWHFLAVTFLLRSYTWTPQEQVDIMSGMGDPFWAPGLDYAYSDTGYVLLGQVIEQLSGQSLAAAVRRYTRWDALELRATWWEKVEPAPTAAPPRARQYINGWDVSGLNATADLYGGGGIVASTVDVALFFNALFGAGLPGEDIMPDAALLALMLGAEGAPVRGSYKRGIKVSEVAGQVVYIHTGYWGTLAYHLPDLDITISAAITDREAFPTLLAMVEDIVVDLAGD